jgi:hypothetical protein
MNTHFHNSQRLSYNIPLSSNNWQDKMVAIVMTTNTAVTSSSSSTPLAATTTSNNAADVTIVTKNNAASLSSTAASYPPPALFSSDLPLMPTFDDMMSVNDINCHDYQAYGAGNFTNLLSRINLCSSSSQSSLLFLGGGGGDLNSNHTTTTTTTTTTVTPPFTPPSRSSSLALTQRLVVPSLDHEIIRKSSSSSSLSSIAKYDRISRKRRKLQQQLRQAEFCNIVEEAHPSREELDKRICLPLLLPLENKKKNYCKNLQSQLPDTSFLLPQKTFSLKRTRLCF